MPQAVTTSGRAAVAVGQHGNGAGPAGQPVRPVAVVLGMRGSGLGLCSQVLRLLGLDMIEADGGSDGEDGALGALHDRILALFDRPFATAYHDFQLPAGWWADARLRPVQHDIARLLHQRLADDAPLGLQDPRIARLLPMWHHILRPLGLAARIVLCLRNPARLARTLAERDGLDPAIGEYRWFVYVCDVFRHLRDCGVCIVEYETWFVDPDSNLRRLTGLLDLDGEADADLRDAVASIVDPALRHDGDAAAEARHPFVRSFYKLVRGLGQDAAAREHIDYIVDQFVTFRQLHRPFEREFEALGREPPAGRQPRAPAPGEIAALQQTLAARDAALAELADRAGKLDERLQRATAQRVEADTALARALQSAELRDAATDRDMAALRDEIAAREARFSEMSRQIEAAASAEAAVAEQARAREAAQAEAAALREALAAHDSDLQQTAARADDLAAQLQATLAQAGAAEAAQAEAAALREALAARDHGLQQTSARADDLATQLQTALDQAAAATAAAEVAQAEAARQAEDAAARLQQALAQRAEADAALARAQQHAALRDAAAQAAAAEAAQLREDLAAREATAAEAARQAEAAEMQRQAAQHDIATLQAQLAQAAAGAEQAAAEHARRLAAAQAETAALRAALAARDTADADATRAGAEAEAAGLRGWLAAAREEIAALRQELAAAYAAAAAVAPAPTAPAAASEAVSGFKSGLGEDQAATVGG